MRASITSETEDPISGFQRSGNNLVHVVVAVLGEATDEEDVAFMGGEGFITLVEGFIFRAGNRVVGIAFGLRVFADDGGAGMLLAGEMFKFGDAGVGVVVGVVDDSDRLVLGRVGQVLVFKAQGAVREGAVAVVEVGVDGAGVDDSFGVGLYLVANGEEVGVQFEADIGVIEHPLKEGGIAILGHDLKLVVEVAVVAVGAYRDAGGDGGAELRGVETPLLAGVAPEEFFVEVAAHGVEDDIFAGFDRVARFAHPVEEGLNAGFVEVQAIQAVDGVLIDGNREQLTVNAGEDAVLVGSPVGEAGQVIHHALGVGVEDVRAVAMDKRAIGVRFVVGVAADMRALVDEQNVLTGAGEAFGNHAAGEARANDSGY